MINNEINRKANHLLDNSRNVNHFVCEMIYFIERFDFNDTIDMTTLYNLLSAIKQTNKGG